MTPQINLLHLRRNPFVKLIIPLIISLIISSYIKVNLELGSFLFASTFIITLFLFIQKKWIKNYKNNYIFGLLIFCNLFLFGLTYSSYKDYSLTNNYQKYLQEHSYLKGKVSEFLTEKTNSYETTIEVESIINKEKQIASYGKIKCYFPKESLSLLPNIGDVILFKSKLNEIEPPIFPNQFDYKQYLASKGIINSVFIPINKFSIVANEQSIYTIAQNLRQSIINQFEKAGLNDNELDILSALFLGHKQSLSKETKTSYTDAGAMHVLAVSGLHVGIILYLLTYLFDFVFGKSKKSKLKVILILLLIWAFALITGLSISVLRSAVMFSFIAIGNLIANKINIYNSIAASAFVILLINPNALFDVGFQLSYIAVIGIVYFHPKIYNLFYVKYKLLNHIWNITAVSISAQIVTVPLSIYYFHQVPIYALFSNLFVIYFAIVIISLGIIALATLVYTPLFNLITILIEYAIKLLNYLVDGITILPSATLNNLYISGYQLMLIYLTILLIIGFMEIKYKSYLKLSIISLSLFLALEHVENYQLANNQSLVFYNTKNDLTFNLIGKNTNLLYTSDTIESYINRLNKNLQNNWGTNDLPKPKLIPINQQKNQEININNKTILILNNQISTSINRLFDYVIINNNEINLSYISDKVRGIEYILGSNISEAQENSITIQNRLLNLKITSLGQQPQILLNCSDKKS